jgi:hypothetical protein
MKAKVSAVIPTLGRSPLLVPCLDALRKDARASGIALEIVVVDQRETGAENLSIPQGLADRVLRPGRNLGFTGGTNLGISESSGEYVATVNDDLLVEPGWLAALVEALDGSPQTAAVQGVNLILDRPDLADGCGLEWNRWWQAVQIGHGEPAPEPSAPRREVFGVSATAALYRRSALTSVVLDGGDEKVFDPRLDSYYEDVELAVRLRKAGFLAWLIPAAQARHAGSITGRSSSRRRWSLIYGNRYLAAARLLGSRFWPSLPRMILRDLLDLTRALLRADLPLAAGIVAGWGRAVRLGIG